MAVLTRRSTTVLARAPSTAGGSNTVLDAAPNAVAAAERESGGVRAMVEASLRTGDVGSIVKLVFALQQGDAAAILSYQDDKTLDASEERPAEAVLSLLRSTAEQQGEEINAICRGAADEVARTVNEMGQLHNAGVVLKQQFADSNELLQGGGAQLLSALESWQAVNGKREGVAQVAKSVSLAVPLLRSVSRAGHYLAEGRLYSAFKVLQRLQEDPRYALLERYAGAAARDVSGGGGVVVGPGGVRIEVPRLGAVGRHVTSSVNAMLEAIGALAMEEFNEWLAAVRSEQRDIGMRAIHRAAAGRQYDQLLHAQRSEVAAALAARDPAPELQEVAAGIVRAKATLDGARRGEASATAEAAQLLQRTKTVLVRTATGLGERVSEAELPLLQGLDMTPLYRCVHIYKCLGRLPQLRGYYNEQRGLQLRADLDPPSDVLAAFSPYIAQIVGFFVIEDCVSRSVDGDFGGQADAGWETALGQLRSLLDGCFSAPGEARGGGRLLEVKDTAQLAAAALGPYGYYVAPLQYSLQVARERYLNMLYTTAQQAAVAAAQRDTLQAVQITDAAMYDDLVTELGLPPAMEGAQAPPAPLLPAAAPFSAMVPELMRIARKFVVDYAQYLQGLVAPGEVLPALRQHRQRLLVGVVVKALSKRCERELSHCGVAFEQCCMLVNDAAALSAAAQQLDEFIAAAAINSSNAPLARNQSRDLGDVAKNHPAFADARGTAEGLCVGVVAKKVAGTLRAMARSDWMPDKAPAEAESAYVSAITLDMKSSLNTAARLLPPASYAKLVGGVFGALDDSLLRSLAAEQQIPWVNAYGWRRLHNDCASLRRFAMGLRVGGLEAVMAKPMALSQLLMEGRVEELLTETGRGALGFTEAEELPMLVQLLEKYCDLKATPDSELRGCTTRTACEVVVKALRAQAGMPANRYLDGSSNDGTRDGSRRGRYRDEESDERDLQRITSSFKRSIGLA